MGAVATQPCPVAPTVAVRGSALLGPSPARRRAAAAGECDGGGRVAVAVAGEAGVLEGDEFVEVAVLAGVAEGAVDVLLADGVARRQDDLAASDGGDALDGDEALVDGELDLRDRNLAQQRAGDRVAGRQGRNTTSVMRNSSGQ